MISKALGRVCALLSVVFALSATAQTASIRIDGGAPGTAISPNLFGIFFEEINMAGDGGLYAELVRNRSFEEPTHADSWQFIPSGGASGDMAADNSQPQAPGNPWSLRLTKSGGAGGSVSAVNGGFWGMNLVAGHVYDLSFYARCSSGFGGSVVARLEKGDGTQVYSQNAATGLTEEWQLVSLKLIPGSSDPAGRLSLSIASAGTVWVDTVSLFPHDTYKGRTNGMRPDLANMLADLQPSFMRFPGGCWVEGEWMTNAYRWKTTIGDISTRATKWNLWQYYSNNGLGYHEYLQLCEDVGAVALFVVNCGMSHNDVVPLTSMGEYVQDALDAIEYANGPATSRWGAVRAAKGHPAPFNLRYIEIGNENGGTAYNDRYALFYDAIKAAYPSINIIACNWGGTPTSRPVEVVDEHYYSSPEFFINNAGRYDSYSRTGPKIYVGEYAVTSGSGAGNLRGALGEAAFMTGMERNSDIVAMSSYAPLFANVNYKRWNPDLIYFDSSRVAATPSYHVQRMFSANMGDKVLPITLQDPGSTNVFVPHGGIGLGSWNTQVEYTNVVVTSNGVTLYQSDFFSGASGWQVFKGTWLAANGTYQQSAIETDCRSTTGEAGWSNYTLRLRARKNGGQEGFLILFNCLNDANWTWWNIGGWNNTKHGVEFSDNGAKSTLGSTVNGQIETGRWYDIRIELNGRNIKCYLDNQLIQEVNYKASHQGSIGVGTWATRASFTNVVVAKGGTQLFKSDFSAGASGWTTSGGTWSTSGGLYRQTSTSTDCRSVAGDATWSDYTLSLRARKDGGNEGFLILFNYQDSNNYTWWNIGGWGNTRHAIEVCENGTKSTLPGSVNGSIQSGQWYDIRVELSGNRIRCYLDNQLVHDLSYPVTSRLHSVASLDEANGQIILKTVNVSPEDISSALIVSGLNGIAPAANWTILTGGPHDENTLDQPENVAPVSGSLSNAGTNFTFNFPANSLTVLRLQQVPAALAQVQIQAGTNVNKLADYSAGVPVRLSSYIAGPATVGYTLRQEGSAAPGTGVLQFAPGHLESLLPLPTNAAGLVKVSLQAPINCQLGPVTSAYFAPFDTNVPLHLETAELGSEQMLYWQQDSATLMYTTNVQSGWVPLNVAPPLAIPRQHGQEFYKLQPQ